MPRFIPSVLFALAAVTGLAAQEVSMASRVYRWTDAPAEKTANGVVHRICRGSGLDLTSLEVTATTLAAGGPAVTIAGDAFERILIVKSGSLAADIAGKAATLSTGSVVIVMPGDGCELGAAGSDAVTWYELRYESRHGVDLARGQRAGGSQLIEWTALPYTAHEVGGRRQPFERVTAMFSESEMHVTTLNPGLTTHAPHTHVPEEIVLMIRGETEMNIAGQSQRGTAGDLFFLGSEVPHNIHNVGTEPAEYYAFQWR